MFVFGSRVRKLVNCPKGLLCRDLTKSLCVCPCVRPCVRPSVRSSAPLLITFRAVKMESSKGFGPKRRPKMVPRCQKCITFDLRSDGKWLLFGMAPDKALAVPGVLSDLSLPELCVFCQLGCSPTKLQILNCFKKYYFLENMCLDIFGESNGHSEIRGESGTLYSGIARYILYNKAGTIRKI